MQASVRMLTIAPILTAGSRQDGAVLRLTRVRIVGPSMEPALVNGDWWAVRTGVPLRAGDVALIVHPHRPDALVVKRLARLEPDGWWVLGDNAAHSEDSRQFGHVAPHLVVGRLWWRYHPLRRRERGRAV